MTNNVKGKWHKGIVEWTEPANADCPPTAYISAVFTWDAATAFQKAVWWKQQGYRVKVGGPGVFTLKRDFEGIAEVGGDHPDTVRRHNPSATFSSRGCNVGCYFCIVPAMEGRTFTLFPDFEPRPILCDNNLSALPEYYQSYVIKRYVQTGVPLLDANSGFEPQTFDEAVYRRWSAINRGPWRFGYDETKEGDDVARVCKMLKKVPPKLKRVYVLIGNEPFEACISRIREVIAWGAEPHAQPVMRLNVRDRHPWVRYDWNPQLLRDVARWTNRWVWRECSFDDYERSKRKDREQARAGAALL